MSNNNKKNAHSFASAHARKQRAAAAANPAPKTSTEPTYVMFAGAGSVAEILSDNALRGVGQVVRNMEAGGIVDGSNVVVVADQNDPVGKGLIRALAPEAKPDEFFICPIPSKAVAAGLRKTNPQTSAVLEVSSAPDGFLNVVMIMRGRVSVRPISVSEAKNYAA